MAKGVSSKTHSQKELDNYANQHNPNNKAYKARVANDQATKKQLILRSLRLHEFL
jgi:hypothetical protein